MKKIAAVLLMSSLTLFAFDADQVYKKCAMCHGKQGEKVALKTSPILNTLSEEQLVTALSAMLDGSSTISSRYLSMHQAKLKGVRTEDTGALSQYIANLRQ